MKTLLTTTAVVAFATVPALAQNTTEQSQGMATGAQVEASAETGPALFRASGDFARATGKEAIEGQDLVASDLIGRRVYAMAGAPEGGTNGMSSGMTDGMTDVGEVSDIILSANGGVDAILLDIGGFLGIGEHTVAMNLDEVRFVNDPNMDGAFFLAVEATEEELQNAPAFDMASVDGFEADLAETGAAMERTAETAAEGVERTAQTAAEATGEAVETAAAETGEALRSAEETAGQMAGAAAEATADAAKQVEQTAETAAEATGAAIDEAAQDAERMAEGVGADLTPGEIEQEVAETQETTPVIEGESWTAASIDSLTEEELTGANLFDADRNAIGEVNGLILDENGNITEAVLDIGGFLGIGEHSVALGLDRLTIQRAEQSGDLRVVVDATEEELNAMPEYQPANDG